MKLIVFAIASDGHHCRLFTIDEDFDLAAWAESRVGAFKLLNIVGLHVEPIA